MEFTKRELELIRGALVDRATDLERYISWVNDRPMLPSKEQAIGTVHAEARETRSLAMKIYDAENSN